MQKSILILGACGQIGTELTFALRELYGNEQVVASDIREGTDSLMNSGPFELLDATNYEAIEDVVMYHEIDEAKEKKIEKLFWPSSIAVFGPNTPKDNTPQSTVMEPSTVYGISKQSGERWCSYYYHKFGVDVRSVRYPGLISWKTLPGGGTTDYAIEIYHEALEKGSYTCFLNEDVKLPMMFMDDAIRATIKLMDCNPEKITVRSSYNLAAMSFSPAEISASIKKHIPNFKVSYNPDFRQTIAETWPRSIDDSKAKKDWGWESKFNLENTTVEMLNHLPFQNF